MVGSILAFFCRQQYSIFADLYCPGEIVGIVNGCAWAVGGSGQNGIPVVTAHIQPAVVWSDIVPSQMPGMFGPRWMRRWRYRIGERFFIDAFVCPDLNRFREELRLDSVRQITRCWHSKWCVGCLFTEWNGSPQRDWPANLIQTDFPLRDEPTSNGLPAEVKAFLNSGDAPIAFTPGRPTYLESSSSKTPWRSASGCSGGEFY